MASLQFEVFGTGKSWADLADEEDIDLKPLNDEYVYTFDYLCHCCLSSLLIT
jgi:hypothetical protein